MALELVPTSKRLFSNDIPQGNTGPPRPCIPKQSPPDQVKVDREGLAFDVQDKMVSLWFLGSNWGLRCVWVKVIGQ